jgi:hypothetical protein
MTESLFAGGEIRKSFAYPKEFVTQPEYGTHTNQIVMVLRPCAPEAAQGPSR